VDQGFAVVLQAPSQISAAMMHEAVKSPLVKSPGQNLVFPYSLSWLRRRSLGQHTPSTLYLHHQQTKNSRRSLKSSAEAVIPSANFLGVPISTWWSCTPTFTPLE
jgi:hypothetical protein